MTPAKKKPVADPDPEDEAPAEAPVDEEAPAVDETVGEAVDGVIEDDLDAVPAPITPQSTPAQVDARITFENAVNADADAFAVAAKAAFIEAALAGQTVELVTSE